MQKLLWSDLDEIWYENTLKLLKGHCIFFYPKSSLKRVKRGRNFYEKLIIYTDKVKDKNNYLIKLQKSQFFTSPNPWKKLKSRIWTRNYHQIRSELVLTQDSNRQHSDSRSFPLTDTSGLMNHYQGKMWRSKIRLAILLIYPEKGNTTLICLLESSILNERKVSVLKSCGCIFYYWCSRYVLGG